MTRVKICGNRSPADAAMAVQAGADAVGVLVGREQRSDDFVEVAVAHEIFAALPPFVAAVLVTHVSEPERIVDLVRDTGCSILQLHAEIDADLAVRIRKLIAPVKLIALVSVRDESAAERAGILADAADALILDSVDDEAGRVGGTGRTHDWSVSARIVRTVACPVVLAGGLNATNVTDAIAVVRPWAVDVNSGVRGAGQASVPTRMREFVRRVRAAQSM